MSSRKLIRLQKEMYKFLQSQGLMPVDISYLHTSREQKEKIFKAVLILLDKSGDKKK